MIYTCNLSLAAVHLLCRATLNDSNQQHYVELAHQWGSPGAVWEQQHQPVASCETQQQLPSFQTEQQRCHQRQQQGQLISVDGAKQQQQQQGGGVAWGSPRDEAGWWAVANDGWGVFAGGLGHTAYFPAMRALGASGSGEVWQ